jgi:beta-galactosidase
MNAAQGRFFWSNQYESFDDILPPFLQVYTTNNVLTLDFCTFSSDMVVELAKEQAQVLQKHAPRPAISTNFMIQFTDFDHHEFAREVGIDFATFGEYSLAGSA